MYWFAFPVLSPVFCTDHSPGAAYKTAGAVLCPWEAFQCRGYTRTQSLLQVCCVTQQLFLCLFTERYFSGKKPQHSVLLQSSVSCGHSPVPLPHLCPPGSAVAPAAAYLEQHTWAGHLALSSQAWKKLDIFFTLEEGHKPEFACLL